MRFRLTPLLASFGVFWWPKFGIALELSAWICTFIQRNPVRRHGPKGGSTRSQNAENPYSTGTCRVRFYFFLLLTLSGCPPFIH